MGVAKRVEVSRGADEPEYKVIRVSESMAEARRRAGDGAEAGGMTKDEIRMTNQ